MGDLKRYWVLQEEEERARQHRHKLKEMSDEHWEWVRAVDGGFSPWFILAVVLFLAFSFIYFAYGTYRAQQSFRPAVKTSAAQGQPPQGNTRRTRAREAPARK